MFLLFIFEGLDKWKVCEREAQSVDQQNEAQNVNDVLCSTTAELVDHTTVKDGDTPQSKSI